MKMNIEKRKAKNFIKQQNQIKKEIKHSYKRLKLNQIYISSNLINSQFYCEKKMELEFKNEEIKSDDMKIGILGHKT